MSQPTAPRTGKAAEDYARSRVGSYMPDSGLCLQNVRQNFSIPSYYYSAIDAWNGAKARHPGDRKPPGCVSVFFDSPSSYKHVATYLPSDGSVVSTNGARIDRFSSISAVESSGFGPYMGWTEDLNEYVTHTGDGGTQEDNVEYLSQSNHNTQTLPKSKWQMIQIDESGTSSIVSKPCHFQSQIQLVIDNLPVGHVLGVRFVVVDYKSGATTKVISHFPTTEIIGTDGNTQGGMVQFGTLDKASTSGYTRRLRVEVNAPQDEGIRLSYVGSRTYLL